MANIPSAAADQDFDPYAKEQQLRAEAEAWDTSDAKPAQEGDILVIDLSEYFTTGSRDALDTAAARFRTACEEVGFLCIVGHQVPEAEMSAMFDMVRRFHALPLETKKAILMDRPDWPVGGMGYLPVKNRKLPARPTGNYNEAFIVKRDHQLGFQDNQWPAEEALPGFRAQIERYAGLLEELGRKLLPVYAVALDMEPDYFDKAFIDPLYRLRMTHYPPLPSSEESDHFGIAPHVDTTFCTILAQDRPGLTIYSERRGEWIKAPMVENSFIVNTGELLRTWTNDRFISVKHFANNNTGDTSRYSIPFFLNANADHKMTCIPSCCGPDDPPKYPPISYNESQAVAQGE